MKPTCALDSVVTTPTSSTTEPAHEARPTGFAACIRAACGGDADALERVAEKLRPRLLRQVRTVLGYAYPEAEDVVDEVFVAMLEGSVEIPGGHNATRRLMRVARNFARRHWAQVREQCAFDED